jgi:hypothetical protein
MKKIIMVLLMFMPLFANAQSYQKLEEDKADESPKMNTLFGGSGELHHGGYGGPFVKVGELEGQTAVMMGGKGGWLINHTITLGIAGCGMVNAPTQKYINADNEEVEASLRFGYGGFYLEYINNPASVVHINANVLFGWGGIIFDEEGDWGGFNNTDNNNDDFEKKNPNVSYFVIEPSIGVEMNVTSFFRIGLDASYRFGNKIGSNALFRDNPVIKDYKIDGFSGSLVFKFGAF